MAATNITTHSQKITLKLNAYDWSDKLFLDTSIILAIDYYNLTNNHWELVMEALPITFRISCLGCPSYHSVALESKRVLEMKITATFIDLIMSSSDIWGREGKNVLYQKRGMAWPYLIKNLTNLDGATHRLLCHVAIQVTVKEVTFWSNFQVQNNTLLPIEMCVVDDAGCIIRQPYNISCISSKNQDLARFSWKDLVKNPVCTIACQSIDLEEPTLSFTAATIYDEEDSTVRYYPKITLCLRPLIEIKTLLLFLLLNK
ncbi:hypothetical protein O181_005725 [Austropuccinia psidii MF-1]|uniref:Vacuolar protein sorting-associated protein 13 VPS13 adaptor binding domain-containing protein n=1 Tax=Austropuccinia psidii MF-1 TaxID=1389203 RepID=A0A9Q3BIX9_9BASI|nr:hypothetical protein [Austropuccinia psidii MF-1]